MILMRRISVLGKFAIRYFSLIVLGVLVWSVETKSGLGQQRWTHLLRPDQGTARFLGLGYGHGYHKANPGTNSDYYNPYSPQNSNRVSKGTEQRFPMLREPALETPPGPNTKSSNNVTPNFVSPAAHTPNRPKVPYEDLWLTPEQSNNNNDFVPNPPRTQRPNSANDNDTSSLRSVLNKF
jgi:hypothetical protein